MTIEPRQDHVPVDGGDLAVTRWGDHGAVVLAAHGITASHRAWARVAAEVADALTLIAPDLRGRGDSATLPRPSSMDQHARDLAAVLDDAGAHEAVLAGHSMGGSVAAAFANLFPQRTRGVVMIDGGPALSAPLAPDVDVDATLGRIIGPALDRLRQRFASYDEYRRFWREHPAFRAGGVDPALIDAYADDDLHGPDGDLRSKVSADAVREDARDTLTSEAVHAAIGRLQVPAVLLLAERGMLDDETPLYPPALVEGLRTAQGPLEVIRVPDTNHYTIAMGDAGARAIAHHLRRFARPGGS
ncbi:MAG TPA: alpha/beta hydrolase [Euzebyales bacterium]|nr:alpha/beta hydrolase [Euzebyales bacterium]